MTKRRIGARQVLLVWFWQARDPNARTHLVFNGQSGFRMFAPNEPFRLRVEAADYEDWVIGGGVLVSLTGAKKGPGSLLVRSGNKSEFAIYLKPKIRRHSIRRQTRRACPRRFN